MAVPFHEMPKEAQLMLCVMYECQHLAGRKGLTKEMAQRYFAEAIAEFGSIEAAIVGIRDRCGLCP